MEASNAFNNYFIDVGKNLAVNLNKRSNVFFNLRDNNISNCSFDKFFSDKVDISEVRPIIQNYKKDTAAGYDKVTVNILKSISEFIIIPLVHIFNLSIQNDTHHPR